MRARFALLPAAALVVLLLAGCDFSAFPKICAEADRTLLLKADLMPWTPSTPFAVPAQSVVWLQVTKLPVASGGVFGNVGGMPFYVIHRGATPNVVTKADGNKESNDASIVIKQDPIWQVVHISPGDWQLYSYTDPGIEMVSCAAVNR